MATNVTFDSDADKLAAEQEALSNILKSPTEGGASGGLLGPGADVPTVLEENPATRQLLEEAILTQTGQSQAAIDSSAAFTQGATVADPTTGLLDESPTGISDSSEASSQLETISGQIDTLGSGILPEFEGFTDIPEGSETSFLADQQSLIETQRQKVTTDLENQITSIVDSFSNQKVKQAAINASRTGATRNIIAATGSSTFASGQSAITGEIQRGADALTELSRLEAQAINNAKAAAAGADIALLQQSINLAEKARLAQNDIRQQQFQNFLSLTQEQRSQSEFEQSRATSIINTIGTLSPDTFGSLDQNQLFALESAAGLPGGFFDAFIATQTSLAEAASQEDLFNKSTELLDLALKLPHGTQFEVGDFIVTGLDLGDRKIFKSDDGQGNITFTTVDPATGSIINVQTIPGISAVSGGGGGTGGGGGGRISTSIGTLPEDVRAYLKEAVELIGGEEGVTSEDVYRGALSFDSVIDSTKFQEQIFGGLSSLNKLGGGDFFQFTDAQGNDRIIDKDTGVITDVPLSQSEDSNTSEPGPINRFIKNALDALKKL